MMILTVRYTKFREMPVLPAYFWTYLIFDVFRAADMRCACSDAPFRGMSIFPRFRSSDLSGMAH